MNSYRPEYESFPSKAFFYEIMFAEKYRINANRGQSPNIIDEGMFVPQFTRLIHSSDPHGYHVKKENGRFLLDDGTTFTGTFIHLQNHLDPNLRFLRTEIQIRGDRQLHSFTLYHPTEAYQAVLTPLLNDEGVQQYYIEFLHTPISN